MRYTQSQFIAACQSSQTTKEERRKLWAQLAVNLARLEREETPSNRRRNHLHTCAQALTLSLGGDFTYLSVFYTSYSTELHVWSTHKRWAKLPEAIRQAVFQPPQRGVEAFLKEVYTLLPPDIAAEWSKKYPQYIPTFIKTLVDTVDTTNAHYATLILGHNLQQRSVTALLTYGLSIEQLAPHYPIIRPTIDKLYDQLAKAAPKVCPLATQVEELGKLMKNLAQSYVQHALNARQPVQAL